MMLLMVLAIVLIAVTVVPLSRSHRWWVRIFDYPRVQVASLGVVTLVAMAGFGQPEAAFVAVGGALLIAVLYQFWLIIPYTPLWAVQSLASEEAPQNRTIKIMVANVLMTNRNADDLIRLVKQERPDLFLALETDGWWDERLREVDDAFVATCHEPLPNTYGLHFFSRFDVAEAEIRHLVEADIPSVRAEVKLASGDRLLFIGVHPKPPDLNQDVAERDAELILVGREAKGERLPVIVAGDLNDVAWSHTTRLFQRISGLLDPRVGRGLYSTFHAKVPLGRWPLDHIFHDPRLTLVNLRRLPYVGSDHFPILVELALEPAAADEADPPRPEEGDHQEARRKIGLVMPKLRARMKNFRRRHPRLSLRRRRRRPPGQ